MKRYLITTADERSWVFDRPVLFLGEWCRRYDRKHIWSKMDGIVAAPYGLDVERKKNDLDYIQSIFGPLLIELTGALNAFHHTEHNERYWNIVLGHWLQRYVSVIFNRYQTIGNALENHEISGTSIFESMDNLALPDSLSFVWASNDDQWNHLVYSSILKHMGGITLNDLPCSSVKPLCFSRDAKQLSSPKTGIKQLVRRCAQKILLACSQQTDAFITNTYLPRKVAIQLQLSFGQLPQPWVSPEFERVKADAEQRSNLKIKFDGYQGVEGYIRQHIMNAIPSCYIEGYKILVDEAKKVNWPKKPKFIFTSNKFDTDEIFKVWLGSKVNQGIPYYVGQHGNNYGTLYGMNGPELTCCDKFLTWGWQNKSNSNVPSFLFKHAGQIKGKFDPKGGLLLIELHSPHQLGPADALYEFSIYQEEQFRFVGALAVDIRRQLLVRLHYAHKYFAWSDEQRWQDYNPEIKLEAHGTPLKKLIASSRLIVHSYDSTGILETLSLNIPTICFWNHGTDHLVLEAKSYYQLLRDVGIFNDSPEQAAEFILTHWNNLDEWWNAPEVQKARVSFCNQYAKLEKHPVRALKRLLKTDTI